jgi:hypothetical protein
MRFPDHDDQRGSEGLGGRQETAGPLGVGLLMDECAELEAQGAASRMDVEDVVGPGHQFRGDEVRDALGRRPAHVAGELPVEVEAIERRQACPCQDGRQVDRRHDDEGALDTVRVDRMRELREGDRSLVFVAMAASEQ